MRIYHLRLKCIASLLLVFTVQATASNNVRLGVYHSKTGFGSEDLALIVNDADPLSVQIAKYYKIKRRIPDINIIHVSFKPGASTIMTRAEFATGFNEGFCSKTCGPTKQSPYFNSNSRRPYDDFRWRPTMMLAGQSLDQVMKLIDRGVASDRTYPRGIGYLVSTTDEARNVRAKMYPEIIQQYLGSWFDLRLVKADYIKNKNNVFFYFTGKAGVKALKTIRFSPGAIADHLTSAGGELTGSNNQMSSLRWLEAGATGSYGAVVEPCNYPTKFPHPGVVSHYLNGETLIEAYWKSVAWPGEGLFIGEPLAAPFAP